MNMNICTRVADQFVAIGLFSCFMYALCVGEIGDVPKVVQKVPQKVQKNRRDWKKVHSKLFQK